MRHRSEPGKSLALLGSQQAFYCWLCSTSSITFPLMEVPFFPLETHVREGVGGIGGTGAGIVRYRGGKGAGPIWERRGTRWEDKGTEVGVAGDRWGGFPQVGNKRETLTPPLP